ncbi:hypothetical protein D3C76_1680800 [compost metagenome]
MTKPFRHPASFAVIKFVIVAVIGLAAPAHRIQHPLPDIRIFTLLYIVIEFINKIAGHWMNMRIGNRGNTSAAAGPADGA